MSKELSIYYGSIDDKNRILKTNKAIKLSKIVIDVCDNNKDKTHDEKLNKIIKLFKKVLK